MGRNQILADIHDFKLDPKKAYKVTKSGRILNPGSATTQDFTSGVWEEAHSLEASVSHSSIVEPDVHEIQLATSEQKDELTADLEPQIEVSESAVIISSDVVEQPSELVSDEESEDGKKKSKKRKKKDQVVD